MNLQEAAAIFVKRRQTGIQGERLPQELRPTNPQQAFAIQAAVSALWCELEDDTIGGWKCLASEPDRPIVGPIYTRTINSVAPVALWPKPADKSLARIEPELAFFFGKDLPPRSEPYTPTEVDAAISRTHMALELINSRYSDPASCEFPEMLADGLVNQGLFIGPEIDSVDAAQASILEIKVTYGDKEQTYNGKHPNNNPRTPLYWLAEHLRSSGQGIIAGQAIITGSYAGVLEVPIKTDITIEYTGLGIMEVSFTAKS